MKKLFTLFAMMFLLVGGLFAQKLSYQAVVRDNDNKLVVNTALTVEVSILNANNGVQYAETHNATSNQNGLIVLTIGEGTVTHGTNLSAVDWEGATINSVIKNGNTTVATISSPVNAVPYALQAANASGSFSQVQADWNETNTASKAYIVNKPDLSVFITTETDPTVPAWAKATTKPAYQYSEIQNTPTIPTTVASLTDASDYAKVADMNEALGAKADTAAVKAALNGKADANNVYTKAETDNLLNDKADAADLAAKADANNVYTKAETDNLLNDKADAADLAAKADANNVYTKAETDNLLGDKADAADLATKANTSDIHNSTITINQNGALVGSFTLNQAGDQTINLAGGGSGGTGVAQTLNLNGNTLSLTPNGGSVTLPAETDPTVPAWAKTANKPVYNYSEIQNKPDLEGYATTTAMNEALALKANAADVYTKTEVNDALALKANAADMATALDAKADKTAMNDALALKANAADVYTKTEVNDALALKANAADMATALDAKADKTAMNDALALKANAADVYTKTEVNDALALKANAADMATALDAKADKTAMNDALALKANAADVYTKTEVNDALALKANAADMATALETKADKTAMNDALALKANAADVYTKTEVNDALALKANAADMATALETKADKTAMNDALALKANAADVYTKTEVNDALALKANAADVYTKTEMNTALNGKADTASVYTRDVMNTKLAGKADNNAVFTKDETKDAISDSLDNIRAQMSALSTQMSNLMTALNALQVATEKFIATAGQTSFTLGGTPNGNVVCYVNGVMVGSTSATSANTVITVSGTTVTYQKSYNYNYTLQAGDVVTFMYVVRANN